MGGGGQTTTTQSGPPAQVLQNYQSLIGAAANQVAQPYAVSPLQLSAIQQGADMGGNTSGNFNQAQNYLGQAGQPLNNAQQNFGNATNNINQAAGLVGGALPYYGQAAGQYGQAGNTYGQAAGAINNAIGMGNAQNYGANVQNYMSPYTQDVVNATQSQFNNQNAQQSNQLLGQAIQSGNAFGGDRAGVAQAALAGQQQLAQAPVIAGLENQGYTNAQNQLATQQGIGLQGAQGLSGIGAGTANLGQGYAGLGTGTAGLGTTLGNLGLAQGSIGQQQLGAAGANEQLAGQYSGLGQQGITNETNLGQLQQQLAMPGYSQLGWLGNLVEGTGSLSGGASTTNTNSGGLLSFLSSGGAVGFADGGGVGGAPVPETSATLALQQKQLLSGHRAAQLFPQGKGELSAPKGIARVKVPNGDVFHYNPAKVSQQHILRVSAAGRENEILGLGPFNKADVAARVKRGEPALAVVERSPDGTEVRAAGGTPSTAPVQVAHMERQKSPGHTIHVESLRDTLAKRAQPQQPPKHLAPGGPVGDPSSLFPNPYAPQSQSLSQAFMPTSVTGSAGAGVAGKGPPAPPTPPKQDSPLAVASQATTTALGANKLYNALKPSPGAATGIPAPPPDALMSKVNIGTADNPQWVNVQTGTSSAATPAYSTADTAAGTGVAPVAPVTSAPLPAATPMDASAIPANATPAMFSPAADATAGVAPAAADAAAIAPAADIAATSAPLDLAAVGAGDAAAAGAADAGIAGLASGVGDAALALLALLKRGGAVERRADGGSVDPNVGIEAYLQMLPYQMAQAQRQRAVGANQSAASMTAPQTEGLNPTMQQLLAPPQQSPRVLRRGGGIGHFGPGGDTGDMPVINGDDAPASFDDRFNGVAPPASFDDRFNAVTPPDATAPTSPPASGVAPPSDVPLPQERPASADGVDVPLPMARPASADAPAPVSPVTPEGVAPASATPTAARSVVAQPNLEYLRRVSTLESGNNPNAATGSYRGLYQFKPGKYGITEANWRDPGAQAAALRAEQATNHGPLSQALGREATPAEDYFAHQQGLSGAISHLTNPDVPAWQNMVNTPEGQQKGAAWAKQAIWGNMTPSMRAQFPGGVDTVTSGEFASLWSQKYNGQPTKEANDQGLLSKIGSIFSPSAANASELDQAPQVDQSGQYPVVKHGGNNESVSLSPLPTSSQIDGFMDKFGVPALAALFAAMASPAHSLGQTIGAGGLAGIETYAQQQAIQRQQAQLKFEREKQAEELKLKYMPYTGAMTAHEQAVVDETHQQNLATAKYRQAELDAKLMEPKPFFNSETGQMDYTVRTPEGDVVSLATGKIIVGPHRGQVIPTPNTPGATPGAAPNGQPGQPPQQQPGFQQAAFKPDGIWRVNSQQAEAPTNYSDGNNVPHIEKGMTVPEPMPTSGYSADTIKTAAEWYIKTGKQPPISRGASPVAQMQNNYAKSAMNYGNALAASRGLTREEMTDIWQTAPRVGAFILGQPGQQIIALGTAMRHLETLKEYEDAWQKAKAGDTRPLNAIQAYVKTQWGDDAATNLSTLAHIVGPEIIKAIGVAGAGTDKDRADASAQFTPTGSDQQVKGAILATEKLLRGQLIGKENQARAAGLSEGRLQKMIGEKEYLALENLDKAPSSAAATPGAPAQPAAAVAKPTLQQFLERAQVANPSASPQALTDFYNKKYGQP